MRLSRLFRGVSLLFGSALISGVITHFTGFDSLGTVALTTVVGFVGGVYFASGWYSK